MNLDMKKHMENTKKPSGKDSSVHYGSEIRFDKAKEQQSLQTEEISNVA